MMNPTRFQLMPLFLSVSLLVSPLSIAFADTVDTSLVKQKEDCDKNTAYEWSNSLNRCVGKAAAIQSRQEADTCNAIADLPQREACHKGLAEKASGLSADPSKLNSGNTTGSLIMNTAYSVVAYLNMKGSKETSSSCTSKKIFAVTAMAGMASDFFLKYKAKKKVKELGDKYKLEVKTGASDAQVKALEYLKEEQSTVAEIASMEKKRNMLLMMGYGAAGVMAAYELATTGSNPDCAKPDTKADKAPEKTIDMGAGGGRESETEDYGT